MMNVFFVIDNIAITPSLEEETILNGVTRNSVATILLDMDVKVEERRINIDEVIAAHKEGRLQEVFGTGTAATIAMIQKLKYRDYVMEFDESSWKLSARVKQKMNDIRERKVPDTYNWLVNV
jgi:branched-chain amino acid aminotransferase